MSSDAPSTTSSTPAVLVSLLLLLSIAGTACGGDNSTDGPTCVQRDEKALAELITNLIKHSDNRVRPGVSGNATVVRIDFYVQSFGPLNEMAMEFAADLDFRQSWTDTRLQFDTTEPDLPVYIPHHSIDKFWIPDIYFPNENSGTNHLIALPNKSIRLYANGTVRYFSRMAMRLSCTMFLAKFPLDTQRCQIKISTYSYDENEVILEWYDNDPIEIHELNLPQFDLKPGSPIHEDCSEAYKTGKFSCLSATFYLTRKVGFFVLQTFIPSILIVMLSWVGFWINKRSEPARVALGVTTVLTMTTQLTSSASNQMKVSYPKAIDVWYSACMVFVFGALLEFAFVNVCTRSEMKLDSNESKARDIENQKKYESDGGGTSDNGNAADGAGGKSSTDVIKGVVCGWLSAAKVIREWNVTSKNIDRLSRRMFPIGFAIFNFFFWVVYSSLPDQHAD